MKLTKIHVESFGKLQNFDFVPGEGLNRLEYPNGWGKTTLATFLKAMLFGFPKTRVITEKNERRHYAPWQGGVFGGYIELSSELGDFRIERVFDTTSSKDFLKVIDTATGKPTTLLGENPGEALFGINDEGFERSVYFTQKDTELSKGALSSITARLHSLLDNVEDAGGYEHAIKLIDKLKKELRTPTGGVKYQQLEFQHADLRKKIDLLTAQQTDLRQFEAKRDAYKDALDSLEDVKEEFHRRREISARLEERKHLVEEIARHKVTIADLEATLGDPPLTQTEMAPIEKACKELEGATSFANALKEAFPLTEERRLQSSYPTGIPSESALEKAQEIAAERKERAAELELLTKGKHEQKGFVTFLPALLLCVVGLGFLIPVLLKVSPLFLIGAIPAIAGGAFLLTRSLLQQKKRDDLQRQIAELDESFCRVLSLRGVQPAVEAILHRMREDARLAEKISAERQRLEEAIAKVTSFSEKLADFSLKYGREEDHGDPSATLARLQNAVRQLDWTRSLLAEKEKALVAFDKAVPIAPEDLAREPLTEKTPDWNLKREELATGLRELERKIDLLGAEIEKIPELIDQADSMAEDLRTRREKYYIVDKTESYLEAAKSALSTRYRDGLEQKFPAYLQLLAGSEVPEATVDSDMQVTLYGGGKSRPVTSFSQGMQDLVDFCLRLSITDALTDGEEKPFLLLDDPFVNLDDNHYEAAKKLLNDLSKTHQIFYFVCRKERG